MDANRYRLLQTLQAIGALFIAVGLLTMLAGVGQWRAGRVAAGWPATDGRVIEVATAATTPPALSGLQITALDLVGEAVTITNAGDTAVNLTGWTIADEGASSTYTFPVFVLDAGSNVTVHSGAGNETASDLYWGRSSPVWNNDGDTATLADASGVGRR